MDLIKESKGIHKCLLKRWEELELKNADIIHDAEERGMTLTKSQVSNYVNKVQGLTQTQILWLCFRYGIPLKISIGDASIKGNEIIYEIPKYNHVACIQKLLYYKDLFKK